jgi:hypothetical protein
VSAAPPRLRARAVVIDLDGTLLDTAADLAAAVNLMLAELGRPTLAESVVASYVGKGAGGAGAPRARRRTRRARRRRAARAWRGRLRAPLRGRERSALATLRRRARRPRRDARDGPEARVRDQQAAGVRGSRCSSAAGCAATSRWCWGATRCRARSMTEIEFRALAAQGYNRIPLMVEAFADLETPLSLYLKLAHRQGRGAYSFLLESVVGGERFGRYSFIGLPARTLLRAAASATRQDRGGHRRRRDRDPPATRWTSSRVTSSASRWRCGPGPAALLRRPGRLLRLRHGAPHRAKLVGHLPARHAGLPRHPAAAVRGAGRHRQPVGQAVPDRLCRPGPARGLQQRQEAPLRDLRSSSSTRSARRSSRRPRAYPASASSPRPTTWLPSSAPSG